MPHPRFFSRVDRILRRSLGVSETAKTDASVKPAPPVASVPVEEEELSFDDTHMQFDPEMFQMFGTPQEEPTGQEPMRWEVEEIDDDGNVVQQVPVEMTHDEL